MMRLVASSAGIAAYALILAFGLWMGILTYNALAGAPDQQIGTPSSTVRP